MKYPNGKKTYKKQQTSHRNRGITFENDINNTNKYYLENDIAVIHKKPTPIKVIDVNYQSRHSAVITKSVYSTPSTTDYNGLYKGKYIDFEAKETSSKTSFSLSNIHNHQVEHLYTVDNHGGISFLLIKFSSLDQVYLYPIKRYKTYFDENNRKSIPLEEIKTNGYLVKVGYSPRYDYLQVLNKLYFKEGQNGR